MLLVCFLVIATPAHAAEPASPPSAAVVPAPSQWLSDYDGIRLALVADDASAATTAARSLASSAGGDPDLAAAAVRVASATDTTAQRSAFSELSRLVVLRASAPGASRVLVYHCPMFAGFAYWIQPKAGIANPYMGAAMPECGEEVSMKAAARAAVAR